MVCTGVLQIMGSIKSLPQQGLQFSVSIFSEAICDVCVYIERLSSGAGMAHAVVEHSPPTQVSHQCGLGSIPGLGVKCGLSLLLVLVLAPRGSSPGTPVFPSPQKPTFPNSNSFWNSRATGLSVIIRGTVKCHPR